MLAFHHDGISHLQQLIKQVFYENICMGRQESGSSAQYKYDLDFCTLILGADNKFIG